MGCPDGNTQKTFKCFVGSLRTACNDIGLGKRACPELLGEVKIEPITAHGQYETPLYGERLGPEDRRGLLDKIMKRASECDGTFSAPSSAGLRRQTSGNLPERERLGTRGILVSEHNFEVTSKTR